MNASAFPNSVPFSLTLVGAALLAVYWYQRRKQRLASLRWPLLAASAIGHSVHKMRSRGPMHHRTYYSLRMEFSYAVNGESYQGVYFEYFPTPGEAERQFENYLSLPLYVRYNPRKPADYFVDPYRDVRGTEA